MGPVNKTKHITEDAKLVLLIHTSICTHHTSIALLSLFHCPRYRTVHAVLLQFPTSQAVHGLMALFIT